MPSHSKTQRGYPAMLLTPDKKKQEPGTTGLSGPLSNGWLALPAGLPHCVSRACISSTGPHIQPGAYYRVEGLDVYHPRCPR